MIRSSKKIAAALTVGLLLVGCTRLLAQHRPDPGAGMAMAAEARELPALEPGVARVTVGRVTAEQATIWWKSPYAGQTTILYARDAHLTPVVVERTTATANRTVLLTELVPDTRYYLQVETTTPLGVARSATVSFRTSPLRAGSRPPEAGRRIAAK